MSKMSNLDLVLDEMITAGQKMIEAATALREMFSETAVPEKATEVPVKEVAPEPEVKKYTFQEVRGVMASLSGKGRKAEAKSLLTKYGASRLSEVKEADYAALVAEAKVILNG
ncbi:hypothetical protein SDC9_140661 [bioreactor metagenome]|uniref:DNA ligase n=1 Tax=bioreactor metagenome TaxID=1076179 RepID=A0A645DYW3_9ZZZZ